MWESRVLCEISKVRWKSFCDFHGTGISIAVSGVHAENVGAAASLDRPGCPREDAIDRIEGKGLCGCLACVILAIRSMCHRVRSLASEVTRGLSRGR